MKSTFIILFCLCASSLLAQSFNERVFTYKNVNYVTKIPQSIPDSLAWTPGSPLKLQPDKAFTLANKEFQQLFSKIGKFNLDTITLSRISDPNGWIYMIVFVQDSSELNFSDAGSGVKQANPLSLVYYVTLDGSVYGPKPQ